MKIYKTQKQIEADVKDGALVVNDDVKFEVSFKIEASLRIAGNISAGNISAWDISAWDISARNISARNISFYAVCFAYVKFICKSITGKRDNSKFFCLDSEVVVKDKVK